MNPPRIEEIVKAVEPYVQMPKADYDALLAHLEDLEDTETIRQAKRCREKGEESFPLAMMERIYEGETAVKVFREHRGLTQTQLAKASGVNRAYLSEIESGKKRGSLNAMKALAEELGVSVDDLV